MQGFHQRVLCHFISLLLLNASRFSELFHLLFKYLSSILKKKIFKNPKLVFRKTNCSKCSFNKANKMSKLYEKRPYLQDIVVTHPHIYNQIDVSSFYTDFNWRFKLRDSFDIFTGAFYYFQKLLIIEIRAKFQ